MHKSILFDKLLLEIDSTLKSKKSFKQKLNSVCQILFDNVDYYNWVGFYLVDKEKERQLVLETFVGEPTEHIKIPFGKGICGQAADRKTTFVVQDVASQDNYLSCSINVKSEIVVPILKDEQILGELDIDSHVLEPFDLRDREFLEQICLKLSTIF